MVDLDTEFGRRVEKRLGEEVVIWLTTVGEDLGPHPRPVWFVWDGSSFLMYSQRDTWKLRHIAKYPLVALHLNSDAEGEDVAVWRGRAEVVEGGPAANEVPEYLEKYSERIVGLGMSIPQFADEYSVAIRVFPSNVRGA